jgi:hypothetical protein
MFYDWIVMEVPINNVFIGHTIFIPNLPDEFNTWIFFFYRVNFNAENAENAKMRRGIFSS